MTYEEAHKILEDLQRLLTNYRHISKQLTEANGVAIEAVEKQIQKKPIIKTDRDRESCNWYCCPVCGEPINPKCGCQNNDCRQAIDWSEEE